MPFGSSVSCMNDVALYQTPQVKIAAGHGAVRNGVPWRKITRRVTLALACAFLLFSISFNGLFLAGYRLVSTRGDSMEPTISSGSLLLARRTAPADIQAGDIIAFPGTKEGIPSIVHRVVVLQNDGKRIVALTMGDNNPVADLEPLFLDNTFPRVVLILPYLGWWATPALGWHLLAISALLGLRLTLRWRTQRKIKNGTINPFRVVLIDGAGGGQASVPLQRRNLFLSGSPLRRLAGRVALFKKGPGGRVGDVLLPLLGSAGPR